MQLFVNVVVGLVAAVHVAIFAVEMFLWKNPKVHGRLERLAFSQEEANKVAPIVANAGLYNLFIAAGLVWSLFPTGYAQDAKLFFLTCAAIAGVYGAVTLKWTTIVLQTLPALLAMLLVAIQRSA
jgi:putative membrane protein